MNTTILQIDFIKIFLCELTGKNGKQVEGIDEDFFFSFMIGETTNVGKPIVECTPEI
jgi:hypothetical protein